MHGQRNYFTLCTMHNGQWYPQFGDYNIGTVQQEKRDSYLGERTIIVVSENASQRAVNAAIAKRNATYSGRV